MLTDEVSKLIVEVARRTILPRFGRLEAGEIVEKRPGDPVTVADKQAEAELGEALSSADPEALVVGEEGVFVDPRVLDALPGADHAWVIDPVDGTRNFARSNPDFGVIVAEVSRGQTVRGWIYQPVHELLFTCERGGGVLRNGQPLSPPEPTRQRLLGATYVPLLDEAGADVALRRTWGACAVDYPKLFTGEVDFIAYRTMFPWDHLAGALMVEELGGKSATDEGAPYCAGAVGRRIISAMAEEAWATACETLKLR